MADPIPYHDINEDTGVRPDRRESTGMPRWVKVTGIIALVLILLFAIMMLVGGGHGPGRHMSSRIVEFGVQALA